MGHRQPATPAMGDTMSNYTDLEQLDPRSVPGWAHPAWYATIPAVFYADGGDEDSGSDAEPDTTDDAEPGSDDEPGEEEAPKPKPPAAKKDDPAAADEYTPPTRSEWERTQAALKKSNEDAKRNRFRAKELEEKTRTNETEHEKALREAREEGEKRYRAPLVKAAARAALSEAGVSGSAERVLRLLDTDGLSVDEDGDIIGLESEIERVKSEYPEFFQAPQKAKPKARPTAADRKPAEEKPKSSAEQHAMRVLGRTG